MSACNAGDQGSIPGSGRSHGEGQPTLVFSPGEFHGEGAWWATVHGVVKRRTRLSDFTFFFTFPSPRDPPDPGVESRSPASQAESSPSELSLEEEV